MTVNPAAPPIPVLEPLGLVRGEAARAAVAAGLALPFLGGDAAFTLARLHDGARGRPAVVRATEIAGGVWAAPLACVTAPPPGAGLPDGPLLMGILNATPDSFSDGGRHRDPRRAAEAGRRFVAEGAALLDVGGESTRPGAETPTVAVERDRVVPVLQALDDAGAILSVDTRRVPVMAAAISAGARLVNDVSALAHDPDAIPFLSGHPDVAVALTHMRGTPATMAGLARYDDVAVEVVRELARRVEAAVAGGIARHRLVVDPGIGFAKTPAQSAALLGRLPILAQLGCRVLLGVSRKSFIGRLAGIDDPCARAPGTLAAAAAALPFPGAIHRVHEVAPMRQFLSVAAGLAG